MVATEDKSLGGIVLAESLQLLGRVVYDVLLQHLSTNCSVSHPDKTESEEFRSRSDFGGLRAAPVRELRRMKWFGLWALQGREEP